MLNLKTLSASRIKTYEMCLYKYYMNYHLKKQLKTNWGAVHGSLLHEILRRYAAGDRDWMRHLYAGYSGELVYADNIDGDKKEASPLKWAKEKEFKNIAPQCDLCCFKDGDKCRISSEQLDKLSGCPKNLFQLSVKLLTETINRYQSVFNNPQCILGIEYPYTLPIKDVDTKMIGYLDLVIEKDPETVMVIDYKSGVMIPEYDEFISDIQVRCYSWVVRKIFIEDVLQKGYKYKYVVLKFDYLRQEPMTIAYTQKQDYDLENHLADIVNKIKNTKRITRVIGDGDFNWKCKYLCDIEQCEANWKGNFDAEANT